MPCHDEAVLGGSRLPGCQISQVDRHGDDETAVVEIAGPRHIADRLVGLDIAELAYPIGMRLAELPV
jgi:hypothetical protein